MSLICQLWLIREDTSINCISNIPVLMPISIFSVTEFRTFGMLYPILCLRCRLQIILEDCLIKLIYLSLQCCFDCFSITWQLQVLQTMSNIATCLSQSLHSSNWLWTVERQVYQAFRPTFDRPTIFCFAFFCFCFHFCFGHMPFKSLSNIVPHCR